MGSLTDRTVRGLLWMGMSKASQALLNVIVLVILARLLSPTEFGIVGAALVVIGFSQIFSQLGIGPAVVQRKDLSPAHIRVGFTLSVALGCAVGALIYATAALTAEFFRMPDLVPIVRVLAVVFPFTGMSAVGEALLQRRLAFRTQALLEVVAFSLGYGAIGISAAIAGLGVWALVAAQLGQTITYTVLVLSVNRGSVGFLLRWREAADLLSFGSGFSLARIANYGASQADNMIVGRVLGAAALGTYGRAYQFLMMPVNLLGQVADKVLFPAMASVQTDDGRLARAYTRAVALIAMLTLPLSGFLIVAAPEIIHTMLGSQWSDVTEPFRVLACILVFRTSYKMSDSLARAKGAVYRRAWRQWVYASAVVSGAALGSLWGIGGVAVGVAVAVVINFLLMLDLSVRLIGVSWVEIGRIHLRHGVIGLLVAGAAHLVSLAASRLYAEPLFLVISSALAALLTLGCIRVAWPRAFGDEGEWVGGIIRRYAHAAATSVGAAKPTT